MTDNSVQRRSIALTVSIVLHGLILLFLLLYRIITPIPPFPQSEGGGAGLELALGFTEQGMGDNSASTQPSIPQANTQPAQQPEPQPESEVLTNEAEEEAPVVPKTPEKPKVTKPKSTVPKTTEPKKPTQEEREQAFKNQLNSMWDTKGTGSSGKGASDTPGIAGGATGSPNGTGIGNGTGSYRGDGWSIDLAGRTIRKKPSIQDKPNTGGKVVLDIWVSPDGKVQRTSQNTGLSTTLDQSLVGLARRAALESSFFPDPKAREDQKGTMTFIFILQ